MNSISSHPCDDRQGDPTSVYRYYDRIGLLIYVGITRQGAGRNAQHNGKAEWWPFVARQEVDHYPTRKDALRHEKDLIWTHRPPFNKQHNPEHAEMREAYLSYVSAYAAQMESPIEMFRSLQKRLPLDVAHYEGCRLILRSRLSEGPLVAMMQKAEGVIEVRGQRRGYGQLTSMELTGPMLTLICTLRSARKVRPPEGGIGAAEAVIGWANNAKPQHPFIRRVSVTEGDLLERPIIRTYGPDTLIVPRAV